MATTRTFADMLNDYLPNSLLREEMVKRNYLLNKVEKDDGWLTGPLIVPFQGAHASSVSFGSLTDEDEIAQSTYVRGEVSSPPEVWGSLTFNSRDLREHGKISEQNFLRQLPDEVEAFMDHLRNVVSVNLMNGAHMATLTADATTNDGLITVDHPERFTIGMKVQINDTDDSEIDGWVTAINMETKVVTVHTTFATGTVVDFSANNMTVANSARVYHDQAEDNSFTSLRSSLLSLTNGGSTNLYGQAKTAYPYLQAINVSGTAVTASNILEEIFDALTTIRNLGKGNPTDIVMSYKNLGSVLKVLETNKGAFNVVPQSQKASVFGWTEIMVGSVTSQALKIVGVQEMDDDVIFFLDWRALTFYSNGMFRKEKSPDGNEFYTIRGTSGYRYIVDIALFGELILKRPSYCGIMHTISY